MNDLIIGVHSIKACFENRSRIERTLYATGDALKEFSKKDLENVTVEKYHPSKFQVMAKKKVEDRGFRYQRIPSGCLLETTRFEFETFDKLYSEIRDKKIKKIIALDRVTDIHNAGAILRTASFYGVDALIIGAKMEKGFSPSLYRVASGSIEYLNIYQTNHLSRVISKLSELGVQTVGLSEHAENTLDESKVSAAHCLVLGTEETGLSNAVKRKVDKWVSLESQGHIKSLNVSVAAAVSMEKVFSINANS